LVIDILPLKKGISMKIKTKLFSIFLIISNVVVGAGLFSVHQLDSLYNASHEISIKNGPLADAAMEIKLTITTAHLWFEEIMIGVEEKNAIKNVWALLDETAWYCDAILAGGKNAEGIFYPVNDEAIEMTILHVKKDLEKFKEIAHLRYDNAFISQKAQNQSLDDQFDALFKEFIAEVDEAEEMLHDKITKDSIAMGNMLHNGKMWLIFITLICFICIALPLYYVSRDILTEVGGEPADIAKITEQVAAGNLNLEFDDKKQITGIYASIRLMVQRLTQINAERKSQNWLKTGEMDLAKITTGEQNIMVLAKNIISFLTTYVDAQIGLFYLAVESDSEKGRIILKRIADYAHVKNESVPTRFDIGEGLVGQVALEKKVILRAHTQEEYNPIIQSSLAQALINHVILLPFLYESKVRGVIELGLFEPLTTAQQNFLEQVMPTVGTAVNIAESREKMHALFRQMQTTKANVEIVLNVGYLPILDHLTLLVSHIWDSSIFKRIVIRPRKFKSWNSMSVALEKGSIDAAFMLSPLAMKLFNQGIDIKAILLAHRDGSAITVRYDSGIYSVGDLKGKKIAIPHRTSTHTALLNHYLQQGGISLKDVMTEVIAPVDMIKALKQGSIDAFIVAEPFGSKAQHDGIGRILTLTKSIINHHVECIVVVKQAILRKHVEAIQEWVDSLIRVGKFIDMDKLNNGSKMVAQMTANRYWSHSENTIIAGLQNPVHRISFSDLNPSLTDFETIMNTAQQAGIIDNVNLHAFIDRHFYENALKTMN